MKIVKKLSDFFFNKIFIITMFTISAFVIKFLCTHTPVSGSCYQVFLGAMAIMLPIMMIIIPRGPLSDNSKGWKIFNIISVILLVIGGFFLLNEFKARPSIYSPYTFQTVSITENNKSILVEFENGFISKCDKSAVKYDSINTLKNYECYKIDIFGDKTPGMFCFKSNLMKDYVFPQRP